VNSGHVRQFGGKAGRRLGAAVEAEIARQVAAEFERQQREQDRP
jgi:hypothetical protein